MKILLLSMPDVMPQFPPHAWRPPNLACGLVAANMPSSHEALVADLMLKRDDIPGAVRDAMAEVKPRLVGLSSMSFQWDTARRVARMVKEIDPDVKIALGGYHATLMAEEFAGGDESGDLDFMVRAEGDFTLGEVAEALEGRGRLADVKGLTWRDADGSWRHNPPRGLTDLATIEMPRRSARIWSGYGYYNRGLDVLETSRGCTMPCKFCSMFHMYGRTFRPYAIDRVVRDVADAKRGGVRAIAWADDNITLDTERMTELCKAITRAGHDDVFYITQASCAGIAKSEDLVKAMDEANWRIVFLGIENVSERNLRAMKKPNIVPTIQKAIELLHKHNILIVGGMILGLADDDEEAIAQNFEFFDSHDIDFYGDQIVTPYPKTEMRDDIMSAGLVTNPNDLKWYNGYWANVRTYNLSSEELLFLRWKYRRKYSTFFKTTPVFRKTFPGITLFRDVWLRPWRRWKMRREERRLTEREIFENEMLYHIRNNCFFPDQDPAAYRAEQKAWGEIPAPPRDAAAVTAG